MMIIDETECLIMKKHWIIRTKIPDDLVSNNTCKTGTKMKFLNKNWKLLKFLVTEASIYILYFQVFNTD